MDDKQRVREFLADGLRHLHEPQDDYQRGYRDASRNLARDLCGRLDIPWDKDKNLPKENG